MSNELARKAMPGLIERVKLERRNSTANGELTEGGWPQKDTKEHQKNGSAEWDVLCTLLAAHKAASLASERLAAGID